MGAVLHQFRVVIVPPINFRHYPFDITLLLPTFLQFVDNVQNKTTFITSTDWVPTIPQFC